MKHWYHLIPVVTLCVAACFFVASRKTTIDYSTEADTVEMMSRPTPASSEERAKEEFQHQQETQTRIEGLAKLEAERDMRQRAAEKSKEAHHRIQDNSYNSWNQLLKTNHQSLQLLLQEAAKSPKGEVHCTLCDGTGNLRFCIICNHNDGKCIDCSGTGKASSGIEYCPTCRGSGKCFVCSGTGKMQCPFCDDGVISIKTPLPPYKMPVL